LILMGVSIYGMVVLSKGIGIVHNFSAWRGFGVIMIFIGIIILIAIVVVGSLLLAFI
jgi:hypothetical protein